MVFRPVHCVCPNPKGLVDNLRKEIIAGSEDFFCSQFSDQKFTFFHLPHTMTSPSNKLEFESLETKHLMLHASAEFEDGVPRISIDIQEGYITSTFLTDPPTLFLIAKEFENIAAKAQKLGEEQWYENY